MYRSICISGVLFVTMALCWFAAAQKPSSAQNINQQRLPKWEYRELEMHDGHFDKSTANKMGEEGWELVIAFTPTNRDAVSIMVLKRRK